MSNQDVRWLQRFDHFKQAHAQLLEALDEMASRKLNNLEKQGTIQAFEFTYELAWNVLRDYLLWQGVESVAGSRDAIREGFRLGLIADGHAWLAMLQDRIGRCILTIRRPPIRFCFSWLPCMLACLQRFVSRFSN